MLKYFGSGFDSCAEASISLRVSSVFILVENSLFLLCGIFLKASHHMWREIVFPDRSDLV